MLHETIKFFLLILLSPWYCSLSDCILSLDLLSNEHQQQDWLSCLTFTHTLICILMFFPYNQGLGTGLLSQMAAGHPSLRMRKWRVSTEGQGLSQGRASRLCEEKSERAEQTTGTQAQWQAVHSGKPRTRKNRNEQRKPGRKSDAQCCFIKSLFLCFHLCLRVGYLGGLNMCKNPNTVQILYFHLAVSSDTGYPNYTRGVVSVGEVTSPFSFSPGNICHYWRWQMTCQHTLNLTSELYMILVSEPCKHCLFLHPAHRTLILILLGCWQEHTK